MRLKWVLNGVVVLGVLGIVLLQMFGPNSGGTLGPQTTYLTAPLAEDGLPNYMLAIVERQREGVTPENNGARLFWQAIGPESVTPEQFDLLCRELGVEFNPAEPTLVDVRGKETARRVKEWIVTERRRVRGAEAAEADDPDFDADAAVTELVEAAYRTPWTAEQLPPLAAWVAENEAPLDLLVAASAKERFFSPPPNMLANPHTPVIEMLLPHVQNARTAIHGLAVRAMFRAGQRRFDDAWDDCLAMWRWGDHLADGPSVIDKLLAIAIRGVAKDCTLALLQADGATEAFARQAFDDLNEVTPVVNMADSLDRAERFMTLDSTLRMVTGRLGGLSYDEFDGLPVKSRALAFDIDVPLRMVNEWYDRFAAAAAIEDFDERRLGLTQIDADLRALSDSAKNKGFLGVFSRRKRSETLGEVMITLLLPGVEAAVWAQDRDETNVALTRTAAALAVHRARMGQYPESLGELVPATLAAVPLDPYRKQAPVYERRGDGYVLYSVFENGADDGGLDFSGKIVAGEWLPADEKSDVDYDESDLVFRVPTPAIQWPGEVNEPAE